MTLKAGQRLGPYEIVESIGAGGMGEVWRAKDSRLDRFVAIKILPHGFAQNEQFLQRFDREARAISSLNHPNICTLYDVGMAGLETRDSGLGVNSSLEPRAPSPGLHYLVMELIEGESLADRLKKGPLELPDVLKYGQQIASALDAAHKRGVVHRDLKPGNVMLSKTGVKLLDFGLAKTAAEGSDGIEGWTDLPTEAKPLTKEGTILGTFQYMAPEQLEGLEADARTDIFALGAVLYEMASGRRAFQGGSKTSLIAAIVSQQPEPISSVAPMAPPALDHVIRKCLEKDPDDRWQSAHDVASELAWISEAGSAVGIATPRSRMRRTGSVAGWILAALVALAWAGIALLRQPAPPPRVESAILPPEGVSIDLSAGGIALSPDGSRIVFLGHREGETRQLWLRDLGSGVTRLLEGTERAWVPFWSPDGSSIGFTVDGKLWRVSADGGAAELIGQERVFRATWAPNGEILFTSQYGIYRVPSIGGSATKIIDLKNRFPTSLTMLPDGRRFLFTAIRGATEPDSVFVSNLDGSDSRPVLEGVYSNTAYAGNMILFVRDGDLRGQPVDPETLEHRGDSVRIAEGVQYLAGNVLGLFTVSGEGALAWIPGTGAGETELIWVSRDGIDLQSVAPPGIFWAPRLSHDETRVAVDRSDAKISTGDIWIHDLRTNAATRLTFDPADESAPIWTPDDRKLLFYSQKNGTRGDLYERSAAGIGEDEEVLMDERMKVPFDVSSDGRWIAFGVYGENVDIWILDRESRDARPLLTSPFNEFDLRFSPDGEWVAYCSNESGQEEVYMLQFPVSSGKWIVSRGGGNRPVWNADGRQIYYVSKEGLLMSVPVSLGSSFSSGVPTPLFEPHLRQSGFSHYCVSKDGTRILLNRQVARVSSSITLVQNWIDGLSDRR